GPSPRSGTAQRPGRSASRAGAAPDARRAAARRRRPGSAQRREGSGTGFLPGTACSAPEVRPLRPRARVSLKLRDSLLLLFSLFSYTRVLRAKWANCAGRGAASGTSSWVDLCAAVDVQRLERVPESGLLIGEPVHFLLRQRRKQFVNRRLH